MTLATRLYTRLFGTQVGSDPGGNRYFTERRDRDPRRRRRRWVLYAGAPDPTLVPPEWHAWLHYTTDAPLTGMPHHAWQRPVEGNRTGSPTAYLPAGHDRATGQRGQADGDYESWIPPTPQTAPTPSPSTAAAAVEDQYTLTRHSAYAVAANPRFEDAVELRAITMRDRSLVRAVGGRVFDSLAAAQAAERAENAPTGADGRPSARGQFSSLRIGGAEIYIPGNPRPGSPHPRSPSPGNPSPGPPPLGNATSPDIPIPGAT